MCPAQLSYQRYDNLLVRKGDGNLHHAAKILHGEATAVIFRQRRRHRPAAEPSSQ